MLQLTFPYYAIMPGSRCLFYDFKCWIKLKMLLICTCPEYCWCCLKVKFDDSSEEFIISTSLVCSRFMCMFLASYLLLSTVQTVFITLSLCLVWIT